MSSVKVEDFSADLQNLFDQSKASVKSKDVAKFGKIECCLPKDFDPESIKNLELFPDDLWIVTPPKCGTTWMQEIVWLIHTDVDLLKAQCNQFLRIPFLECAVISPVGKLPSKSASFNFRKSQENVKYAMANSIEYVKSMPRPRVIKTHLPLNLLPENILDVCKVVYVGRHPKDACVSWFYHQKLNGFNQDFQEMAKMYKAGIQLFAPIMPHMLEAWVQKTHPNLFFTTYEQMSKNLRQIVINLAGFMGKNLTQNQLEVLLKSVDFETFRHNK